MKLRKYLKAIDKIIRLPTRQTYKKLHLGCGSVYLNGFLNIDITPRNKCDMIDNVKKLYKFKKGYAEEIYACHVLEHFAHEEIPIILKRWLDVLKPGGIIRISVPDIDKIMEIYQKNLNHFHTAGNTPWIGLIYGGQNNKFDFHKTGFNYCWLSKLLSDTGFTRVQRYPNAPHFIPGTIDASLADAPFGEFISLNVIAEKPLIKSEDN